MQDSIVVTHTYQGFSFSGSEHCVHANEFDLYKIAEIIEPRIITRVVVRLQYDCYSDGENGERLGPVEPHHIYTLSSINFRFRLTSTRPNHDWEQLKHSAISFGKGITVSFIATGDDIERVWLNFTLTDAKCVIRFHSIEAKVTSHLRVASSMYEGPMLVRPIFKNRNFNSKDDTCFVLMPFEEDWSGRVWKHLRKTVEHVGLKCLRADNLFGTNILEDIWQAINESVLIIADTTSRNPNVFYEIGISHTLGKKVILLSQNSEDIPFDFRGYRHLIYMDNVDGFEKISTQLPLFVRDALAGA